MKAVLVIDLDDDWLKRADIDVSDLFADVTLYRRITKQTDYTDRVYHCWMPLKEMPQRKPISLDHDLAEGWNLCLEEIEK